MNALRLTLRLLTFLVSAFLFGVFLWYLALLLEVFVFGGGTPECTDSDTCSAFGDVVYDVGDRLVPTIAWFLLSAVLWWSLLFRRFLPIRG